MRRSRQNNERDTAQESLGEKLLRFLWEHVLPTLIVTAIFSALLIAGGRMLHLVRVKGDSMYPAIKDKDVLITSTKITPENIDYGTVVVYDIPVLPHHDIVGYLSGEHKTVVKRVVGKPGDTIQIVEGMLFRNTVLVEEDLELMENPGCAHTPVVLKENEYFCLGDNRNESMDSRLTGPVSIEDISNIVKQKLFPW